ncbi:MAG: DUF308 domain-containing protein [Agathobacter sp.]|nr:DUF308 domain-containing protein [Agathobacter sp.]
MREKLKEMRADFLLSSVLCIILGIVLIVWSEGTLNFIGRLFALILIVIGAVYLIGYFFNGLEKNLSGIAGAVLLLIGIWIMITPGVVVSVIPIIIGVILIYHGLKQVLLSMESKKYNNSKWGLGLLLAVISIVFGAICISNAFGIMELTSIVIGISLIYNGVSNIWVSWQATKSERNYHNSSTTIDVTFKKD